MKVDILLVWMNPIQDGYDRSTLDSMLLDIANTGVYVSTHPEIIPKMGTKEVLYQTRNMEWGYDTQLHSSMEEQISLEEFCNRCERYFSMPGGKVINQAYQDRARFSRETWAPPSPWICPPAP